MQEWSMTRTSSWFQPLRNTENKQLGIITSELETSSAAAVSVPMVLDSHSQAILGVPRHGCIWVQKMGAPKLRPWWPKWQSTSRFEVSSILGAHLSSTVMAPPLCLAFAQQVPLKWRGLGVNWVKPHFRRWWDWDFMDPWVRSFGRKWCHAGKAPCIPQTSPSRIEVLPDVPTKFQKPDPSQKSPLYHHSSPNIPLMNHIFLWISQFASWKKTQKGRLKDPWGMHRSRSGQQLEDAMPCFSSQAGSGSRIVVVKLRINPNS